MSLHPTKKAKMNKYTHPSLFMISSVMLVLLFSGCRQRDRSPEMIVTVSIQPLGYFVDRLTDGALELNVMVPPGASHSTYAPTTQQFMRLSDSGIYLRIGYLGYEQAWIGRLRELNPEMTVLNLSDHTELIQGEELDHGDHVHEGGIDPHIWMSPRVMQLLLPKIRDVILGVYPELTQLVEQNYPSLAEELAAFDEAFIRLSEELTQKSFMIYHPALTYLARDYGFTQISIEHEGKEPSPAMLRRIIRDAREHNIPVIFIQAEYDMRSAELVSRETGAKLAQIQPEAYNWNEIMSDVLTLMREHLR